MNEDERDETCRLCLCVQIKCHLTSIFSEGERSERLRSRILDCCPVTVSLSRFGKFGNSINLRSRSVIERRQVAKSDLRRVSEESSCHVRVPRTMQKIRTYVTIALRISFSLGDRRSGKFRAAIAIYRVRICLSIERFFFSTFRIAVLKRT